MVNNDSEANVRDPLEKFGRAAPIIRRILNVIAVIFVPIAAMFTWILMQPPLPRPSLAISFLGYSNDARGTRMALFTSSNSVPNAVRRISHYRIQTPMGERSTNVSEGWFSNGGLLMRTRETEWLSIVAPTNQPPWRLWVTANPYGGLFRETVESLLFGISDISTTDRDPPRMYGFHCDWIAE
jgi:hypothetical protein